MAAKDAGEPQLSSIVTCSICLDPYKEPKTLRCDHSFCKQCLANIVAAELVSGDMLVAKELSIGCPNCMAEHNGFRSISEIKTSHVVTQILDFYRSTCIDVEQASADEDVTICSHCEKWAKFLCLR